MSEKVIPLQVLQTFSPADWDGRRAPPPDWLIEGLAEKQTGVLFSGIGGIGKSLLMLQLMTAAALGRTWLGFPVPNIRSFGIFVEDPLNIMHRRQDLISDHYGVRHGDLGDMMAMALNHLPDPTLYHAPGKAQTGEPTRLWRQIEARIKDFGAQLVVIDNAGACFTANENFKEHVRPFLQLINNLAVAIDGCVVLIQHPSKDGENDRLAQSGSRMWRNTLRGQWIMEWPPEQKNSDEPTDERLLKFGKNNYGAPRKPMRIEYRQGVFEPCLLSQTGAPSSGRLTTLELLELRAKIKMVMRQGIDRGERYSLKNGARNHVASMLRADKTWHRYAWGEIDLACQAMVQNGDLALVDVGTKARSVRCVRPTDATYPNELATELKTGEPA